MPNDSPDDDTPPLKVEITNQKETKKEISDYDTVDNEMYDSLEISEEQIKEFEENK